MADLKLNLYSEMESAMKKLGTGLAFMDKDVLLMSELTMQMKIYKVISVLGLLLLILGFLI